MSLRHWLVKQESSTYPWSQFVAEGITAWTGVRNFQARNFLRAMRKGDTVLFYHSGDEKQVVGLCRVEREAYPDPTAAEGIWVAVDLRAGKPLPSAVSLLTIKKDAALKQIALIRQSRLSVMPLTPAEFQRIRELGE